MSKSDATDFKFFDERGTVVRLIRKWRPSSFVNEKDYENSLYHFLHDELPGIEIARQYWRGNQRADILVGKRVIVEVKCNLTTIPTYHRLIGQLTDYKEWDLPVLVVLVGETEPNLKKRLDAWIEENDDPLFWTRYTALDINGGK